MPASPHRGDFDGRLERPVLWRTRPDEQALKEALLGARALPVDALACWDFSRGIDRWQIDDIGPAALHGHLHQGPKRAVRGARWSGAALRWHEAPDEYAAIHFHTDDLLDAQWTSGTSVTLPADLRSGVYAVRVRLLNQTAPSLSGGELRLPLFVPPAPDAQRALVALVFPTFTYHAYANDRCALLGNNPEVLAARAITLEPRDVLLSRHPEWGLSLYDTHLDGSGVSLTSRLRPVPGHHPDQRAWQAGEGSGRWNFAGDLLLVQWLEREGIAWDALTDDLLHERGSASLAPYRVALTGNHPEYATPKLLKAWRDWVAEGGRMMYLGGNGFYWKVAVDERQPGLMELRRAEDGNRSWAEEPGEYWHALDGAYGGLWRRNGIAPQSWLGVGYCGQGFRRATGYRRNTDSHLPQTAFVFAGVSGENFGLAGAIGGGCAGIEVDRHDPLLGSDPDSYVLASSLPFDASYLLANEEMLVSRPTITADFALNVRADVVLQLGPGSGAVFSTGSIAWIGGLAEQGGDDTVKRITRNVIDRFLDAAPLQSGRAQSMPDGAQT
jgi:N,N-dimethylformamidase